MTTLVACFTVTSVTDTSTIKVIHVSFQVLLLNFVASQKGITPFLWLLTALWFRICPGNVNKHCCPAINKRLAYVSSWATKILQIHTMFCFGVIIFFHTLCSFELGLPLLTQQYLYLQTFIIKGLFTFILIQLFRGQNILSAQHYS